MRVLLSIVVSAAFFTAATAAEPGAGFIKPGDRDKCPVCGMFVHKYPEWIAEVLFADGAKEVFDGPKDLFKYLGDRSRYGGARSSTGIKAVFVTDYYHVRQVDGTQAFYVLDSDIYGPMGRELVPFEREADARSFLNDHNGSRILRYRDITPDVLKRLD